MMKTSVILNSVDRTKRTFDIDSEEDLDAFREFLVNSRWGLSGCPFLLEYPYVSVPDMIKDKIVHQFMGVEK